MNLKLNTFVLMMLMLLGVCSCGGGSSSSSGGQSGSSVALAPEKPQNVSVTTNSGQAFLKWQKAQRADSYAIYKLDSKIENLSDAILVNDSVTGNSYTVNNLEDGVVYFFVVVASNDTGSSQASDNAAALVASINQENKFSASINPNVFVVTRNSVEEFYESILVSTPSKIKFDGLVADFTVDDILLVPSDDPEFPSIFSKVIHVDEVNGNTELQVEAAGLSEVFSSLEAEGAFPLDLGGISATSMGKGAGIYKASNAPEKLINQCGTQRSYIVALRLGNKLSGCLSMDAKLEFDVSVDQVGNVEWRSLVTFDTDTNIEVTTEGGSDFSLSQDLFPEFVSLPPVVVGLLAFENQINFRLGGDFSGDSNIELGFDSAGRASAGLVFDNGQWSPISDASPSYQFHPPEFYENYTGGLFAGPRFQNFLFGLAGPDVSVFSGVNYSGGAHPWGSQFDSNYFMDANIDLAFNSEIIDVIKFLSNLLQLPEGQVRDYFYYGVELVDAEIFSDINYSSGGGSSSSVGSGNGGSGNNSSAGSDSNGEMSSVSSSSSSSVSSSSSISSSSSSTSSSGSVSSGGESSSSEASSDSSVPMSTSSSSSSVASVGGGAVPPAPETCSSNAITSGLPSVLADFGENTNFVGIDVPNDQSILSQQFIAPVESGRAGLVLFHPRRTSFGAYIRVWVSECAGGPSLPSSSSLECLQGGNSAQLRWVTGASRFTCGFNPGESYYLNVQIYSNGDSCPPGGSCQFEVQHISN
ncbi:fibronectin type III domain-containing protein [Gilvimarinus sp. 1_MG-2023]|uniref:fibronectin type III domain-containing protein n=1 Tax=Gilvimarinus sp. 1_MG-2023 TaxID=3062638 RepID=UPI0026E234B6|nr:fibronectin type III domain-containing protein [Gilvimarinus sp. 1_MG-2023]MDO6747100.1 fibronectin type III domain-containing protein [Gilvimarinus sp. 1_MG-2023]